MRTITKTVMIIAALTVAAISASAVDNAQQLAMAKKTVAQMRVMDMPLTVAKLVAQAPAKERQPLAVALVKAVIGKNQAVAIPVISAIAKEAPEVAAAVSAAAAMLMPDYADSIAAAAMKAAPAFAQQISQAVADAVPTMAARVRNVRSFGSSADQVGASGTITITAGIIRGVALTPTTPPTPAPTPVIGFDPARYSSP